MLDNHKLMYHPQRVSNWMNGETVFPIYSEISLTNKCNHRCKFCAISFSQKERIDLDTTVIKNTITDMAKVGVKAIMFGGEGEPLIHRDIISILKHTKKCGMDIALTTNGVLFDADVTQELMPILSWIKFSVDAGDIDTYTRLHGTKSFDYKRVLDNISRASFYKRIKKVNCKIGVQSILLKSNIETIPKLAKHLVFLHPDYFVVKPYSEHEKSIHPELEQPTGEQITQFIKEMQPYKNYYEFIYRENAFSNVNKEKSYKKCYGKDFMAYIDTKGDVYSCINYIGNPDYCYGNIYKNSFESIWALKKEIHPDLSKCRTICRLDNINRYLWYLKNPMEDINFI